MSQIKLYYVCSRCYRETVDHPPTNHVIGIKTCYFCQERLTTLHVHEYELQAFAQDDDELRLLIFTKTDFNLHVLHVVPDEENVINTFLGEDDYHLIPDDFVSTLEEVGFI